MDNKYYKLYQKYKSKYILLKNKINDSNFGGSTVEEIIPSNLPKNDERSLSGISILFNDLKNQNESSVEKQKDLYMKVLDKNEFLLEASKLLIIMGVNLYDNLVGEYSSLGTDLMKPECNVTNFYNLIIYLLNNFSNENLDGFIRNKDTDFIENIREDTTWKDSDDSEDIEDNLDRIYPYPYELPSVKFFYKTCKLYYVKKIIKSKNLLKLKSDLIDFNNKHNDLTKKSEKDIEQERSELKSKIRNLEIDIGSFFNKSEIEYYNLPYKIIKIDYDISPKILYKSAILALENLQKNYDLDKRDSLFYFFKLTKMR
tara:strand:+ start:1556 stop:2497 length:942 start_codon:yes stop_codon:yes gene_type:complete